MHKVEIYTKPSCPGCDVVKKTLNEMGVEFEEFEIGRDIGLDDLLKKCTHRPRSAPVVFIDDEQVVVDHAGWLERLAKILQT